MQRPRSLRQFANSGAEARPESSTCNLFPGAALEAKPLWAALCENLRDALFPARLPPLELTSQPIPVPDRTAIRTNPWAFGTATVVNGSIVALFLLLGLRAAVHRNPPPRAGAAIDIGELPLFAPAPARGAHGGSGGGEHDAADPAKGRNPRFSNTPIAPPMVPVIEQPRLAVDSTIDIRLPEDNSMPNVGVHTSSSVSLVSNGPGGPHGIGWGANGGVGPGSGTGWGPGNGDRIYVSGESGVLAPTLVYAPEAEFSDEARRQKYQGVCMVSLIVDAHGNPQNLRVTRTLGMGLDEKALEAIHRYKFKPGTMDGKPVPVRVTVRVDFNLF